MSESDEINPLLTEEIHLKASNDLLDMIITLLKQDPKTIKMNLQGLPSSLFLEPLKKLFLSDNDSSFINDTITDIQKNIDELDPLITILKQNDSIIDYITEIINVISNPSESRSSKVQNTINILENF
jgi:hypothetical protein